jgi:hypothetical protein
LSSAAQPPSVFAPTLISSAGRVNSRSTSGPWYIWIGAIVLGMAFRLLAFINLAKGLSIASLCAMASTWVGLRFGQWMRGVQR